MSHFKYSVGVPFVHGKTDCFATGRKFFKDNFDIEITNYARPDNWWDNGYDLYNDYFFREGFRVIDLEDFKKLQPADVLLMALRSEVPNHCAIYLGDGMILHHPWGKASVVERFRFRNSTTHVLRHKDVQLNKEEVESIDLMELILPHKRDAINEAFTNRLL